MSKKNENEAWEEPHEEDQHGDNDEIFEDDVIRAIMSANPEQLRKYRKYASEQGRVTRREVSGVPEARRGTPKDTLVQKLAADMLRELKIDRGLPYREIGEIYDNTTAERVRQLFAKLCPHDYARGSGSGGWRRGA